MEKENLHETDEQIITEEKEELQAGEEPQETETPGNSGFRMAAAVLIIVICIFILIVTFTDFLGSRFGEKLENGVLVLIAVILAGLLLKDKIRKNK